MKEIVQDQMKVLEIVDGKHSLMGFLLHKYHNLLLAEILLYRRQTALKSGENDEKSARMLKELEETLIRAANLLRDDFACPDELRGISLESPGK